MLNENSNFPHINNEMIELGLRRARVERSRAFYSMMEGLFGSPKKPSSLSEG